MNQNRHQAAFALLTRCGVDLEDAVLVSEMELALDEAVHECGQAEGLEALNGIEGDFDQEHHIGTIESASSNINNGGLAAQVDYLLLHNPAHLVEEIISSALSAVS